MKTTSIRWSRDRDEWIVESPVQIPALALARLVTWARKPQIDRWRSLPPGDRKDDLKHAIDRLDAGAVVVVVVGRELVAFQARHVAERSYSFGGVA